MTYESKISNIIIRLKEAKANNPELTLQKIAEHTGVSPSTVTRIFAEDSENQNFRYESIKPIAKMLLDLDSLDEGSDDEKALKAIIQFKEAAIEQLKAQLESEKEKYEKKLEKERSQSRTSIDFLKHQIDLKDDRIDFLLQALNDKEKQYKLLIEDYHALTKRILDDRK